MKYFGGCDVGSTYTKAVIMDENGKVLAHTTIKSKIKRSSLCGSGYERSRGASART